VATKMYTVRRMKVILCLGGVNKFPFIRFTFISSVGKKMYIRDLHIILLSLFEFHKNLSLGGPYCSLGRNVNYIYPFTFKRRGILVVNSAFVKSVYCMS
jgi:hypothetical protein